MLKWLKNNGPGALVVAAFIGPGTVTVCALTGASFGLGLIWAVVLSIIATLSLQEMAARLGVITQKSLTDVIRDQITSPFFRKTLMILIFVAIVIGNTAYEAGNISGASLGLEALVSDQYALMYPSVIGIIALSILVMGSYRFIEQILIVLVILMSLSFITTAIITQPGLKELFNGMIPHVPEGEDELLMVIGIIGTTVVPYNLFLHSSAVKEKWTSADDLPAARKDLFLSIILGGLVSIAIVISASSMAGTKISNVMELAKGLEPLYGEAARYFLGAGLFAAGITSAITAPLAAAYVARSCFGWDHSLKDMRFRMVWAGILILGVLFSSLKFNPIAIITFAQVANGLLLPLIAVILLWVVNKTNVLGKYKNTMIQNGISFFIILITLILGIKGIYTAIG